MGAGAEPLAGHRAGGYIVEEKLGEGAMGAVYLARHAAIPELRAALKVLRVDAGASEERFRQEVRVLAAIAGPGVARLFDAGVFEDGTPWMLMELAAGRSLHALLGERGPLPPEDALAIAFRVADVMARAHAHEVVHRDLKPSNVMVDDGGRELHVTLLDFGVARAAGPLKAAHTVERAVVGTPGYLAPEVAAGRPAGAPSDVFSLGVILFEMIAGARPFHCASPEEEIAAVLRGEPPRLGERARVDPEVEALVSRALARAPEARPRMAELRDELLELLRRSMDAPVVPVLSRSGEADAIAPRALDRVTLPVEDEAPPRPPLPLPAKREARAVAVVLALSIASGLGIFAAMHNRRAGEPAARVSMPDLMTTPPPPAVVVPPPANSPKPVVADGLQKAPPDGPRRARPKPSSPLSPPPSPPAASDASLPAGIKPLP